MVICSDCCPSEQIQQNDARQTQTLQVALIYNGGGWLVFEIRTHRISQRAKSSQRGAALGGRPSPITSCRFCNAEPIRIPIDRLGGWLLIVACPRRVSRGHVQPTTGFKGIHNRPSLSCPSHQTRLDDLSRSRLLLLIDKNDLLARRAQAEAKASPPNTEIRTHPISHRAKAGSTVVQSC